MLKLREFSHICMPAPGLLLARPMPTDRSSPLPGAPAAGSAYGRPTVAPVPDPYRLAQWVSTAQKLETLGRLAGGIAHDFNNILTVILGGCGMLLETTDSLVREEVQEIKRAAERAATLTRQLLAFSRRQALELRVLSLADAVRAVEPLLRRLLREDIQLVLHLADDPVPVRFDPAQLEQVLLNLALNARDAMPGGGSLSLTVRVQPEGPHRPDCPTAPSGPYAVLEVSDTGIGMTPDVQARLFEPFFTTKGAEGTGLGLSTVYGIVTQHGGYIDVTSAPGRGTTFTLYLPLATDDEAASAKPASSSATGPASPGLPGSQCALTTPEPSRGGGETILLVEDDEAVRGLVARTLRQCGYRVLEADGKRSAEACCRSRDARIDLLITDLVLPDASGLVLIAALKALRPELRVLVITGYGGQGALKETADLAVLPKPFDVAELCRRVRTLLDASSGRGGGAEAPTHSVRLDRVATAAQRLRAKGWYWLGSLTEHPWAPEPVSR